MRSPLLICAIAALSACADGARDEKSQYAAALNAYYADNPECVRVGRPADENGVVAEIKLALLDRNHDVTKLDSLTEAGVLTAQDVEVKTAGQLGLPATRETVRRYVLTPEGAGSLRDPGDRREFRRGASELCYGRREVVEVLETTEPADGLGERTMSVRYAYKLTDLAPWARHEALATAFPATAAAVDGPNEDTDELVLTNDGWVHHRLAP